LFANLSSTPCPSSPYCNSWKFSSSISNLFLTELIGVFIAMMIFMITYNNCHTTAISYSILFIPSFLPGRLCQVYVPIDEVSPFLTLIRSSVPLTTPLWLCPVRRVPPRRTQPFSPHGHTPSLLVDVGVYGRVSDAAAERHSSLLEQWALTHNSRKMVNCFDNSCNNKNTFHTL